MHPLRSLLLLLLAGCLLPAAHAQQYRAFARRYGVGEGLPHRQVNGLMQDSRGFIWAATKAGVVRFDGQRFKIINKTDSGLDGEAADWVAEAADGMIWVCGHQANTWLDVIDPVSGKVTPAAVFFKDRPVPVGLDRLSLPPQKQTDGAFVIGLHRPGGWLHYHPVRGWTQVNLPDCTHFQLAKVTRRQTVWGIWVGEDPNTNSLVELDLQGKVLRRYMPAPGNRFALKNGGTADPDAFFVLEGSPSEVNIIWEIKADGSRVPARSFLNYTFTPQYARVGDEQLTVQFPGIFDPSGHCILDLSRQFPELDHDQYCDYLRDKSGNIWFATTFGLVVVELAQDHFQRLLYDENAPGGRGYACRGLLEKNGRLTVNMEALGKGRFEVDTKTGAAKRIPGGYAIGIAESLDGNIWTEFGRPDSGWFYTSLMKTTPDGRPIGPALVRKKENGGSVWAILEESPARVLLGHSLGLTVFNPQTGAAFPWTDPAFPEFDQATISCIQRNRAGDICVCAAQGFYRLKPGGGVHDRYWSGGKGAYYLPYDNILAFYEDADGVYWLGTAGGGLIRWVPPFSRAESPAPRATVLFRKNGLLNGVVYGVYEDTHAHLWMPTDYGIVQFDKKTLQARRTWLVSNGLTHNEFNRTSHCRGADGALYFGGLNGVTAFHPDEFYQAPGAGAPGMALVLSDFNVFAEQSGRLENRTAGLLQSNQITVSPGDRYIQLEFALLDFFAPEKVSYSWMLEGVAVDWENLKEPVLRLSSLPLGTHRLRVRAQAADGTWASNEIDIRLTVLPPYYLRWWFILLVFFLLTAGIRAWLYWRTREHRREQERLESEVDRQTATIRRQTEELKKLDEAKSRFFANVSHELRTPLTLILGPLGSLLKGEHLDQRDFYYAKTAQEHGRQLLHLVNEILDLSKMESGKMNIHETAVSLQPFLRRLVSAFESHAERLGVLLVFEYQLAERLRVLIDEDKLQKVLNNLLSNALKFTPPHAGGSISVRISEAEGRIRIGVHDTGRGIHPDDLPHVFERFYQTAQNGAPIEGGTGIGLALCREFAELMQGRIWVESAWGTGSSFYFEFPRKEVLGVANDELEMMNAERGETPTNAGDGLALLPTGHNIPHSHTILLVEDNENLRDYVQSILSEKYHVITAENGQVAIHRLLPADHRLPDLIISDIMMPVMDGFQLLEQLKGDDRWRHIPVVMLTARADLRDKLRALRIGVDDYLLKPFEEEELLARVGNLLAHSTAHRPPSTVQKEEQEWLERLEKMVAAGIGDSRMSADWLAHQLFVGRTQFYKKVKLLTGMTPNEYIQEVRFTQARHLLETRSSSTVKEAAYSVGMKDVKYFSEQFKKRFGKSPSEYR